MKVLLVQFRKPPVESRFFERLGPAISSMGFTVISAGSREIPYTEPVKSPIKTLPLFNSHEANNLSGLLSNLNRLWRLLSEDKPMIIVFSSPEISLILPAIKLTYPEIRLIFDLQENHGLNLRKQFHWRNAGKVPGFLADLLVFAGLRLSHRIWLAEKIYGRQYSNISNKSFLIENRPPDYFKPKDWKRPPFTFCFTGFISRESGVLRAIDLIEKLLKLKPDFKLLICGYCPEIELRNKIMEKAFVQILNPLDTWATGQQILDCMHQSSAQLIPYLETEANMAKTPSKWFASLACQLPAWYNFDTRMDLPQKETIGFAVNFSDPSSDLLNQWSDFLTSFRKTDKSNDWVLKNSSLDAELKLLRNLQTSA